MATASVSTRKMPLPVELFYGAMERQLPLADYARNLDLHPDILGQALTGRLQGADPDPLNALARATNREPGQLDLTIPPCTESFGMWLKRNMEGITQHGLRTRAQLDSQTLKRFLSGDLLPDSDQAERISRALYIDRLEIARVITANMAAASPSPASQTPEPGPVDPQSSRSTTLDTSTVAGQLATGTRRRRASSLPAAAPATPGETAPAAVKPDPAATGQAPSAGKRPRRASNPQAQLSAPTVAATAAHQPEQYPAGQADPVAGDQPEIAPPAAPTKTVAEKEAATRRPRRPAARSVDAAAAQQTPALPETQTAIDGGPVVADAAEERRATQAGSRRRSRPAPATTASTSGDVPSPPAAEVAPPEPDQRSADSATDRTAPLVTAELAAGTATLQLSVDEVRLIRHWRRLHPHGRRATLQYIGSLLVDD